MLDDLKIFVCAVEHNSIGQAAMSAGLSNATASRKLKALEQALGGVLFHRSNHGLTLTPLGDAYYQECAGLIHALGERLENLSADVSRKAGPLTVLIPTNIASGPLDEFWQQFILAYPEIQLNIRTGDPNEDVLASGADIALRSGEQDASRLRQNILGGIHTFLVCSPDYPGPPDTIDELLLHPLAAADMFSPWTLYDETGSKRVIDKATYRSNDLNVLKNIALTGKCIALLPGGMVHHALQNNRLVTILPHWQASLRQISLVWPYQKNLSLRATLFKDALTDYLVSQPWFERRPLL